MNITEKIAHRLHLRTSPPAPLEPVEVAAHSGSHHRPAAQWLPFADLTPCEQAARVGQHVHRLMVTQGLTTWGLADAALGPNYAPSAQDISDLLHGMRHLRGTTEIRALAQALNVTAAALAEPGWPR